MKRELKDQKMFVKKRIPYLSVRPFSVSGICRHDNNMFSTATMYTRCEDVSKNG
jgi:hypothetical protein